MLVNYIFYRTNTFFGANFRAQIFRVIAVRFYFLHVRVKLEEKNETRNL
jgi:hypothetical protein